MNARDKDGNTALIRAAVGGTAESVKVLLDAGVDLNALDESGWTVLMYAARWGTAENVKVLLEAGADLNARSKFGDTALMLLERRFKDKDKTDDYWKMRDLLWTK